MSKFSSNIEFKYFGLTDYSKALDLQNEYHQKSIENKKSYILGFEHPEVLTLGLRAHALDINDICGEAWEYPVVKVARGGLATIHNPGQLLIYPIVHLQSCQISIRPFVELLFQVTQQTLKTIGVSSHYDLCEHPGVYTDHGKIAFCGLQVKHGVTLHGLSINVNNDIKIFDRISSCGVKKALIDSIQRRMSQCEGSESYIHKQIYKPEDFYNLWIENLKN